MGYHLVPSHYAAHIVQQLMLANKRSNGYGGMVLGQGVRALVLRADWNS